MGELDNLRITEQSASPKAARKTDTSRSWKEFRSSGTTVVVLMWFSHKNICAHLCVQMLDA